MREIEATHIAQLDPFEICPEALDRVQLRGIGRKPLYLDPLSRAIGQERCDEVTTVNRWPIPEEQQTAGHLAQQMFQKGYDIDRVDRLLLTVKIELTFRGEGADRREMIPGPPFPEDGGLAYWSIRADDTGQGIDPGFIDEEERLPLGFGPLLSAGQVSSRQRVMATSSRWRARRAGFCGPQWMAWHKRPTGRG